MSTSQAGLLNVSLGQIHIVISENETEGAVDTRLYWKPFVNFIWYGCVVMALGGFVSLSDRRLRVGAPVPARLAGRVPAGAAE